MMVAKGLWVSDTAFVPFAEANARPVLTALATRQRVSMFDLSGMPLPNPDPVLRKLGRSIEVYRELLSDASVGGMVRRRKAAVKSMSWRLERGNAGRRTVDMVTACLNALDMDQVIGEMLDAVLFGYAPLEVMWQADGGLLRPEAVIGKPPEWFCFDAENRLCLKSLDNPMGERVPERKFLLPRQNASYQNPYGSPDLAMVFWPATFKRGGLKFWVNFTEKFGTPWIIGKEPRGTPVDDSTELMDRLAQMVQDAVAVVPDDTTITIEEASGKAASADLYEQLLMYCRSEIAIAILGQNQTTEANSNRASATAGLKVAQDIRDADAKLVQAAMQTLIDWVCGFNSNETSPRFVLYETDDLTQLANRDKLLSEAGARLSPTYFERTYNLQAGDVQAVGNDSTGKTGASFAEAGSAAATVAIPERYPDQDALDAAATALTGQAAVLDTQGRALTAAAVNFVASCTSYGEALEGLAGLFPAMNTERLEEALTRALFVAELWGQAHGDQ
jgi:phage gp29-like protein